MRRKTTSYNWIAFAILVLVMQISASYPGFKLEFLEDHFLSEGIFQADALASANGSPEFVVAGKNYTTREMYLYLLTVGPDLKPKIKWQSENLFEDRSVFAVAAGHFSAFENQLLALTDTKLYLYQFTKDEPVLISRGKQELHALNLTSGDLDGDGKDELITATVGQVTNTNYNCRVQVWKLENNQVIMIAQSGLIGNIRSLTTGDLENNGKNIIVAEEGPRTDPGNFHVLRLTSDNQLTEDYCLIKGTKSAAYGMKIRNFPSGIRLMTGTANGKIDFYKWSDQKLLQTGAELSFSSGLVDVDALDLNGDKLPDLLVACYPQRFIILSNMGGMN